MNFVTIHGDFRLCLFLRFIPIRPHAHSYSNPVSLQVDDGLRKMYAAPSTLKESIVPLVQWMQIHVYPSKALGLNLARCMKSSELIKITKGRPCELYAN